MSENKKKEEIQSHECYIEPGVKQNSKPKFFITFPYCYMNGKLHLGHLFSLSKADFFSRYMEMKGFNAFFPLAFHCTGMPISASALKLEEEIKENRTGGETTVFSILKSFGFEEKDIYQFTDPQKWLDTFPDLCKETLLRFHANIDFTKSFITTDRNVYYDSFIQYQFRRLKKSNLISFGKRYTIYDPTTNQACLDHDRSIGEGVLPVVVDYMKVNMKLKDTTFVCLIRKDKVFQKYVIFAHINQVFCVDESCYENLIHQIDGIEEMNRIDYQKSDLSVEEVRNHPLIDIHSEDVTRFISSIFGHYSQAFNFSLPENELIDLNVKPTNTSRVAIMTNNIFRFYEPENYVKSRSGAKCVVSLMDQWFLNYNDEEWKVKARKCVNNMENIADDTKTNLLFGIDWIQKWGCSRSFGLGTRLPFDKQYLIESLSDSTIYMAFYTFKDLLFSDFYGVDEILPKSVLCDEMWEVILNHDSTVEGLFDKLHIKNYLTKMPKEISIILNDCRNRFSHFYPNDIRFSGKDLTNNHLIFYIMNHCALFDEKFWPKRIFTNGHLLLNSQKMSKSTGNFMTADDCIFKYGVSATRMALAICGDGNEDANFIEDNANSFVTRLSGFIKILTEDVECETMDSLTNKLEKIYVNSKNSPSEIQEMFYANTYGFPENDYENYADQFLYDSILYNYIHAIKSYESLVFRDVIKYSFYEMFNARDMFIQLHGDLTGKIMDLWKDTCLTLLYPVIPSLCIGLTLSNTSLRCIKISDTLVHTQYSFPLIKEIEYLKKIIKRIKFIVKKKKPKAIKVGVGMEYSHIKQDLIGCDGDINRINTLLNDFKGKDRSNLVLFAMDYSNNKEAYERVDEMRVLTKCREHLGKIFGCEVGCEVNEEGDPLAPVIDIKYN